ncbi:ABC transporter ATP-binding protein [Shouchella clausii]|uniref:ABC transporter ATP-binding protein n=1 Tax=Shouchella clausii TaxID=79880 RepID=UPI001B164C96|nr:ABC transporter ATP-binding protein [Shouchella clausii]GIN08619.1 ABC transporter ATP-binding protein [Shouchella clausii]
MGSSLFVQGLILSKDNDMLVEDVEFQLPESSCLMLIGESGSGKTLTGLAIAGLLPRGVQMLKGKIVFNGTILEPKKMSTIRGQEIAYVFQNYASTFSPQLPLGKQLHETLAAHTTLRQKKQREVIAKALNEVGLSYEHVINRYAFQMSGGQLQRISIAAAIMLNPSIIIADEPTTALDPHQAKQILELLHRLKVKKKCSILLTTHDLSIARQYSDHIVVMHHGRIVEYGSRQDVLAFGTEEYTQKLIQAENVLDRAFQPLSHRRRFEDSDTLLHVKHLEKSYRSGAPLLEDVSFSIKKGECVGLIGASGSGKSTLARCLLRLESYDAGQITFHNQPIKKYLGSYGKHGNIQVVFQHPELALNSHMKIIDSLLEPLDIVKRSYAQKKRYRKKRYQHAEQLMAKVGLAPELLERFPNELSGGQKQRVCIARAISTEPEFLILDEPTASLDMIVQAQVIQLLRDLQKQIGYSSFVISHDLRSLNQLADRILRLEDGGIKEGLIVSY